MDRRYTTKVHYDGPDKIVVEDGGSIEMKSGSSFVGVPKTVTPSAAGIVDINALLTALAADGTIAIDTATAEAELAKVLDAGVLTVPFGTSNTKVAIEAAMLVLADALVAANYSVTIAAGSTYNTGTGAWTGSFVVTKDTTPLNTAADAEDRAFTVIIAES